MFTGMTAAELIVLLSDHFEEVTLVWEELAQANKGATLKDAAEEWLRRQKKATP